ncbi:MAG: PDZ domain-containing protein [Microbacterium sp.]|uniref:YlbL family protein n=1 Tax=Microbacterium sp. TaxID=51671 RepID=UPI0039E71F7A
MALFDEPVEIVPARRRRRAPRGMVGGMWALVLALAALLAMTFLPTSFVIQQPGPVYDTLGETAGPDGETTPLISVEGAETFPTAGSLDLLTVQIVGNRERTPSWFELALAWFDPARAVMPLEAVFPAGQTTEQRDEESAAMMVDSQKEATAAALQKLDYDVNSHIEVYDVLEDAAAAGVLEPGDTVVEADGEKVASADELREAINELDGQPVPITIERDGTRRDVTVTPKQAEADGEKVWIIGVTLTTDFDFPIDVTIQLDNVGGPSAGMMFALGIIDTLTPGELNGGEDIAGTGTITADGVVGAIGGIRQKLYGAKNAGADFFLSPRTNCNEVQGHVPDGLRVFAVDDLDDALAAVQAIADGGDLDALPTCTAADLDP